VCEFYRRRSPPAYQEKIEMIGTNHPKLYCGLMAQRTERCLISRYQSVPKRTRGKIRCNNFCCFTIMRKPNGNAVMPLSCPQASAKAFLVAGLLCKLNGKNSNLQVATIQQPFLFGRFPTACRKKARLYRKRGSTPTLRLPLGPAKRAERHF
jgi:hypothetical protein